MVSPIEKQFADCCGAGPLELMIEREEDHAIVAHGALEQPFAVIGRDPYCDIHLNDPVVALKHAFAQVINGHVFIVDLASTTGVHWGSGRQSSGWLTPGEPLTIGPFRLFLTRSAASSPTVLGADFHPLTSSTDGPGGYPPALLEFLSGRSDHTAWEVNRVLTLVGRASECKLHLGGEDVALFHSYFVKTITGLWVVDLLARGGTRVNGKKVRAALLAHGDELHIGKFAIGVKYPAPGISLSGQDSAVSFDVQSSQDRVHTGSLGMKSSARISRPPETMLAPDGALPSEEEFAALTPAPIAPTLVPAAGNEAMMPMLRQMAEMQSAMFGQFQQSLMMMMQMFGQMHQDQMGKVQTEMSRMVELNSELQKLQGEMFLPALPAHVNKLPDPDDVPKMTEESAETHNQLWQRMEKLNDERQSLWKRLLGKVTSR